MERNILVGRFPVGSVRTTTTKRRPWPRWSLSGASFSRRPTSRRRRFWLGAAAVAAVVERGSARAATVAFRTPRQTEHFGPLGKRADDSQRPSAPIQPLRADRLHSVPAPRSRQQASCSGSTYSRYSPYVSEDTLGKSAARHLFQNKLGHCYFAKATRGRNRPLPS